MASRIDWEPLPLAYLIAERDAAKAVGDERLLTLLREISRLHWFLVRAHQVTNALTAPGVDVRTQRSLAEDLHRLLLGEPSVQRDNERRAASLKRPPASSYRSRLEL